MNAVDFSGCLTPYEVISVCLDANPANVDVMINDAVYRIRFLIEDEQYIDVSEAWPS